MPVLSVPAGRRRLLAPNEPNLVSLMTAFRVVELRTLRGMNAAQKIAAMHSLTYMALTARACHHAVEEMKRGAL